MKFGLGRRALNGVLGICTAALFFGTACRRSSAISAEKAKENVALLVKAAQEDVGEVRRGLPRGTEYLAEYFAAGKFDDANQARDALERARNKVQDLRVSKGTFFALVDTHGIVLRSDQSSDLLAGKSMFVGFPELRSALEGKYVETRGEMPEAASVRGKKDAEWVAAAPVRVDGNVRGLYASGWSWSAYAYRLENQLRSSVRSSLRDRDKEPLLYVYMIVGKDVFGAPVSPEVNANALRERNLSAAASADSTIALELEITEREFGLAFRRVPEFGSDVGIAVLRSET